MKGSDDNLIDLTPGQADQFARLGELWPEYGHSLQVTANTTGGMGWRKVDGVDYLTRYTQENGKKKGRSLGRRGPETEAQLAEFENTVLKARRTIKERQDEVALACRLAKAHGSARLHGRLAAMLEWLWYTDADRRVALFGGSALLAYESETGVLTPPDLIKERHLQFVARSDNYEEMALEDISAACGAAYEDIRVTFDDGRYVLRFEDHTIAEVYPPTYFLDRLDDRSQDIMKDALDAVWMKSLIVSRDCRPIEINTLDPRVYALAASVIPDDEMWQRRAVFAVELVRHRWADGFDADQEEMIEDAENGGWSSPRY